MIRLRKLCMIVLLLGTLSPAGAWSFPQYGADSGARPQLAQNQKAGQTISKKQAIRIAQRRVAGKVLSADLVTRGPQQHYRVKMLTDSGRVKTVIVNASR